jgi:hypothetical protein
MRPIEDTSCTITLNVYEELQGLKRRIAQDGGSDTSLCNDMCETQKVNLQSNVLTLDELHIWETSNKIHSLHWRAVKK